MEKQKITPILCLLWLLEGVVVGFGAILPGISGGTLCVAFGMYRPIIETLSNIKSGIKNHGIMLAVFAVGIAVGFVGLSGVAALLMEKNMTLVTCAFIGFILGTLPELWSDAGKEGRKRSSYIALAVCFAEMLAVLTALKTNLSVTIAPNLLGFLICGVLWGLSFVVPGLSSSSLLLFFGLYKPMLDGISSFSLHTLIPMGFSMAACVLLLSKSVGAACKKHYSVVSHGVLGIVAATAVMILPPFDGKISQLALNVLFILLGALLSFFFTRICTKIDNNAAK